MATGRVVHLRLASAGVSGAATVYVNVNSEEKSLTKPETKHFGMTIFAVPLELAGVT